MSRKATLQKPRPKPKPTKGMNAQREKKFAATIAAIDEMRPPDAKAAEVLALLKSWLSDESGYDEEAWPKLKKALNR